eukprot:TRINITY_DN37414_c0_g1_i1.p1 TRINITY_DN37414_c0_g1~~TRINITY_DN37414_c0_g1_i1.p1  ORF type:complete len:316 (+),score=114.99 TRINITY_DN37414_c0_g1_i1:252-1199(+)
MKRSFGEVGVPAGPPSGGIVEDLEIYEKFFFPKFEAEAVKQKLRHDGRGVGEVRPFSVQTQVVGKALGSSLVTQGMSRVICATRVGFIPALGKDSDEGRLEVRCTIPSVASEGVNDDIITFRQRGDAIAEYVKKMIMACNTLDLKQLCVEKEACACNLHVDLYVLNCDGSLRDACLHAAVGALLHTSLPHVEVKDNVPVPVPGKSNPLQITQYPLSLSFAMYHGELLPDLTAKEEDLMDAFSVVHDSTSRLVNVYKQGGRRISDDHLKQAINAAKRLSKPIKEAIEATLEPAAATESGPTKKKAKTAPKRKGKLF